MFWEYFLWKHIWTLYICTLQWISFEEYVHWISLEEYKLQSGTSWSEVAVVCAMAPAIIIIIILSLLSWLLLLSYYYYYLDQKLCLLAAIIGQKGGNLRKLRWQLYHMLRFGPKKKSSEQCWHINTLFYKIKLRWQLYHTRKMMGTGRWTQVFWPKWW